MASKRPASSPMPDRRLPKRPVSGLVGPLGQNDAAHGPVLSDNGSASMDLSSPPDSPGPAPSRQPPRPKSSDHTSSRDAPTAKDPLITPVSPVSAHPDDVQVFAKTLSTRIADEVSLRVRLHIHEQSLERKRKAIDEANELGNHYFVEAKSNDLRRDEVTVKDMRNQLKLFRDDASLVLQQQCADLLGDNSSRATADAAPASADLLAKVNSLIKQVDTDRLALSAKLESTNARVTTSMHAQAKLEAEVRTLREQLQKQREETSKAQSALADVRASNKELSSRADRLQSECAQATNASKRLQDQLDGVQKNADRHETAVQGLQQSHRKLDSQHAETKGMVLAHDDLITDPESGISIASVKQSIGSLQTDLSQVKRDIADKNSATSSNSPDLASKEDVMSLSKKVILAQQQASAHEQHLASLQQSYNNMQTSHLYHRIIDEMSSRVPVDRLAHVEGRLARIEAARSHQLQQSNAQPVAVSGPDMRSTVLVPDRPRADAPQRPPHMPMAHPGFPGFGQPQPGGGVSEAHTAYQPRSVPQQTQPQPQPRQRQQQQPAPPQGEMPPTRPQSTRPLAASPPNRAT